MRPGFDLRGRPAQSRSLADRSGLPDAVSANQLLSGRGQNLALGSYVLLERLGEGGMGQVFKARHVRLGRIAALKVIRKDRFTDPAAIRRFHREIHAVAQLSHPNIVLAFDADEVNGQHFFTMEYVEGSVWRSR